MCVVMNGEETAGDAYILSIANQLTNGYQAVTQREDGFWPSSLIFDHLRKFYIGNNYISPPSM